MIKAKAHGVIGRGVKNCYINEIGNLIFDMTDGDKINIGFVGDYGLLGYVTPQMFGAVADGISDDTIAIQNAIDFGIENNMAILLPMANYAVSSLSVSAPCYIHGNNATLISNSEQSVLVVNAETDGNQGYIGHIRIDCSGKAKAGLEVQKNINVFKFEYFNIRNVVMYGVYCNGGSGKFNNFHIQSNIKSNNQVIGVYSNAPDFVFNSLMTVNCLYGFYTKALGQLNDFHPWNSFPELMKTGVGVYSESLLAITNSYFDTLAVCFAGNNAFYIVSNLILFWSSKYYTDQAIGDDTTLPSIIGSGVSKFYATGIRCYKPRGRSEAAQYVKYLGDGASVEIEYNPFEYSLLESVKNVPNIEYTIPNLQFNNGFVNFTENPVKRYAQSEVIVNMIVNSEQFSTTSGISVTTLPSGYRPKQNIVLPIIIGNKEGSSVNQIGSVQIRTTGIILVKAQSALSNPSDFYAHIYTRYKTN